MKNKKTLITFVHFERGKLVDNHFKNQIPADYQKKVIYTENLNFFLAKGLTNSPNHHFNFIINSPTGGEQIPQQENISVIKGHNKGYDVGGYHQSIESSNLEEYDYFIFMNDTCRGPFLPTYLPQNLSWVDLFLDKLDDKVKMVGPTWFNKNYTPFLQEQLKVPEGQNTHIQSYCFGLDKVGLDLIRRRAKFQTRGKAQRNIIKDHEVGIGQLLIKNGYQLKPFQLSHYGNQKNEDVCHNGGYYGININPIEVMFFKTIGSGKKDPIATNCLNKYTKWTLHEEKK